mmetsp:Transcript_5359/g.14905  ORF Transcript_5359/g.14905 Transcript_5359/m.14905 type:complete len:200 (+) Transcript_5359:751-1350(+)
MVEPLLMLLSSFRMLSIFRLSSLNGDLGIGLISGQLIVVEVGHVVRAVEKVVESPIKRPLRGDRLLDHPWVVVLIGEGLLSFRQDGCRLADGRAHAPDIQAINDHLPDVRRASLEGQAEVEGPPSVHNDMKANLVCSIEALIKPCWRHPCLRQDCDRGRLVLKKVFDRELANCSILRHESHQRVGRDRGEVGERLLEAF